MRAAENHCLAFGAKACGQLIGTSSRPRNHRHANEFGIEIFGNGHDPFVN